MSNKYKGVGRCSVLNCPFATYATVYGFAYCRKHYKSLIARKETRVKGDERMAVIDYGNGISRDTAVLGDNVYTSNGQGCGTVWYPSAGQARKVIASIGKVPQGQDSGLCEQCSCHYSYGTEGHKKYPEFACKEWKKKVAKGKE